MGDDFNPKNKGMIQRTCCVALLCTSEICSSGLKLPLPFPQATSLQCTSCIEAGTLGQSLALHWFAPS